MSDANTLTELFTRFPGIGPRQARRFVFFLLRQDAGYRNALVRAITDVAQSIRQCAECGRYAQLHAQQPLCDICADPNRSRNQLMIVEKDTDVEQMEKSNAYHGRYFVLGGTLSITGKKKVVRDTECIAHIEKYADEIEEIILALSATTDGEYTSEHIRSTIQEHKNLSHVTLSTLGRGLSTGSELEYADANTLTQALKNRA